MSHIMAAVKEEISTFAVVGLVIVSMTLTGLLMLGSWTAVAWVWARFLR